MPSVSEPFGITALEAISAGTPTIASKTAGFSEAFKNCLRLIFGILMKWQIKLYLYLDMIPYIKHLQMKENER